jgi:hypothetical protein
MPQELERVRDRKMDLLCINVDIFIDVGMEWYTKSFDDCILDEDPECAFNSSEYTFSRAIPYFCGQDPRCLYERKNKLPDLLASNPITLHNCFSFFPGFHAAGGHYNERNSLSNTNTRWWESLTR